MRSRSRGSRSRARRQPPAAGSSPALQTRTRPRRTCPGCRAAGPAPRADDDRRRLLRRAGTRAPPRGTVSASGRIDDTPEPQALPEGDRPVDGVPRGSGDRRASPAPTAIPRSARAARSDPSRGRRRRRRRSPRWRVPARQLACAGRRTAGGSSRARSRRGSAARPSGARRRPILCARRPPPEPRRRSSRRPGAGTPGRGPLRSRGLPRPALRRRTRPRVCTHRPRRTAPRAPAPGIRPRSPAARGASGRVRASGQP